MTAEGSTVVRKSNFGKKVAAIVITLIVAVFALFFAFGAFDSPTHVNVDGLTLQMNYADGSSTDYFGSQQQFVSFSHTTVAGGHFTVTFTIVNQDFQAHTIQTIQPFNLAEFQWLPSYQFSPVIPTQLCGTPTSGACSPYSIPPHASQSFTIEFSALCSETTMLGTCLGPSYAGPLVLEVTSYR